MEEGNKKNIAIVINSLKLGGGAERVASLIGTRLKEKGHRVSFLVFKDFSRKYNFQGNYINISQNIEIKNSWQAFRAIFFRAKKISRYSRDNDLDLIISFMEEANFANVFSRLLFRQKAKIILSVRNNPQEKKLKARMMIRFFYRFANKVVANSYQIENILKTGFNLSNTLTIYNPLDFARIDELKSEDLTEKERSIFKDKFVFINIGRLYRQKGQIFLLRAFARLAKERDNVALVIIGEGKLRNKLESFIKYLELEEKVYLLGEKDNVYKFLAKSDCFILSSLWEGLPNTLLEAAYLGLSLISTDCISGPREIIAPKKNWEEKIDYPYENNNGVLIKRFSPFLRDIKSPLSLEEKILYQVMKKELEKGPRRASIDLQRFSSDFVIKEWEKII